MDQRHENHARGVTVGRSANVHDILKFCVTIQEENTGTLVCEKYFKHSWKIDSCGFVLFSGSNSVQNSYEGKFSKVPVLKKDVIGISLAHEMAFIFSPGSYGMKPLK